MNSLQLHKTVITFFFKYHVPQNLKNFFELFPHKKVPLLNVHHLLMYHDIQPGIPVTTEFYPRFRLECLFTQSNNPFLLEYISQKEFGTFVTFDIDSTYEDEKFFLICLENTLLIIQKVEDESIKTIFSLIFRFERVTNVAPMSTTAEQFLINNCERFQLPTKKAKAEIKAEVEKFESQMSAHRFRITDQKNADTVFVVFATKVVSAYYIRRHYFPSSTFVNQSFFDFDLCKNNEMVEFNNDDFILLRALSAESNYFENLSLYKPTGNLLTVKVFTRDLNDHSSSLFWNKINYFKELQKDPNATYFQKCYGYIKSSKHTEYPHFIFQFMSNGNLNCRQSLYYQNKFNENTIKTVICLRLIAALSRLHSKGLIHGDLKSESILINHNYECFIGDSSTTPSLQFASPEQFISDETTFQSDLYGFAMIIYQLATGRPPFHDLTTPELLNRVKNWKIPPLSSEIGKIIKIYQMCTKMNPKQRSLSFYVLFVMIKEELFFDKTEYDKLNIDIYKKEIAPEFLQQQNRLDLVDYLKKTSDPQFESYLLSTKGIKLGFETESLPSELFFTGNLYQLGLGVTQNSETAAKLYKIASAFGHLQAKQNLLNNEYENLQLIEETKNKLDFEIETLIDESNEGIIKAQIELGLMYANGDGVAKDFKKAVKFLEKAARKGNVDAIYHLGLIFENNDEFDNLTSHQVEKNEDLKKKKSS